jgi:hypothetical protein
LAFTFLLVPEETLEELEEMTWWTGTEFKDPDVENACSITVEDEESDFERLCFATSSGEGASPPMAT